MVFDRAVDLSETNMKQRLFFTDNVTDMRFLKC